MLLNALKIRTRLTEPPTKAENFFLNTDGTTTNHYSTITVSQSVRGKHYIPKCQIWHIIKYSLRILFLLLLMLEIPIIVGRAITREFFSNYTFLQSPFGYIS